jgi:Trk K+ transport system NAD-binding subunit
MKRTNRILRYRKFSASWRDTWLLLRQFRWPLLAFVIDIIGGGYLYYLLSIVADEPVGNPAEGMYHVLGLTFIQPIYAFPRAWYLELFYFLMPVIGIGIFAQGVAEFGVLFFNRRARGKEWEMAVASTYKNHVILVGLGHLGFRVVRHLHQMDQDVVVIEKNPRADLVSNVRHLDVTVIEDDASRESTLEASGVRHARSIILCTQNDSLNLHVALKARDLNPAIHVIIRIFDDDFAQGLQRQFGFTAMSATGMAAPAFASAAAGVDMTSPIAVEGETLSLARLNVPQASGLVGQSVGQVEMGFNVSIVLLRRNGEPDFHPSSERQLKGGDVLAILGGPGDISSLVDANQTGK